MADYVEVAVPLGVRKTFAYSLPPSLQGKVTAGSRVLVPFGRKWITGFVLSSSDSPPQGSFKIRAIRELLDPEPLISPSLIPIALWIADYYFAPPGEAVRLLAPIGAEISGAQKVSLTPDIEHLLSGGMRLPGLKREEEALLDVLAVHGTLSAKELSARSGIRDAARFIERLAEANYVRLDAQLTRPRVTEKARQGIRVLTASQADLLKLTRKQRILHDYLAVQSGTVPLADVLRSLEINGTVAKALVQKKLAEIVSMAVERMPVDLIPSSEARSLELTAAQQGVFREILLALRQGRLERFLLHGVTGSGKTEIYLRLIAEVLKLGGTALYLVPEIGLTPLLSRIAASRFPHLVALMHSGMSVGERFDQWRGIRSGQLTVVLGTRSAVFAPLENLKLAILDEEQDTSYKQDEVPCYHAREVAWQRLQRSNGLLLLGSATPSIESYYSAVSAKTTRYLSLPERIESRPLAEVSIVDMRIEFQRRGKSSVISSTLQHALNETLQRGEQAIVLLNRRGFSRSLLCRSCGHVSTCTDCSIPLTYHQGEHRLICHYCGSQKAVPGGCEQCGGQYVYFVGVGTEQLEQIMRAMLPAARLARADRDTTRKRGALRKMLLDFSEKKLDILLGTQMLAKGHDFPHVTLVGVLAADAGLAFPDFRAAERTFQLLTQVAGRSGRGKSPGRVIIQAYYPEHYALQRAARQDYCGFYQREIEYRKMLGYPPFRKLIQILIESDNLNKTQHTAEKVAASLKTALGGARAVAGISILGPAPAPIEKLRGKHRYQVLIRCGDSVPALSILRNAFESLSARKVPLKGVRVDVDPMSLL